MGGIHLFQHPYAISVFGGVVFHILYEIEGVRKPEPLLHLDPLPFRGNFTGSSGLLFWGGPVTLF